VLQKRGLVRLELAARLDDLSWREIGAQLATRTPT